MGFAEDIFCVKIIQGSLLLLTACLPTYLLALLPITCIYWSTARPKAGEKEIRDAQKN